MQKRNDYAVSTYALSDEPLEEAVLQLIHAGWKGIEVMCEGRHIELLDWNDEQLASLKRIGEENGIRWSLHAPITGCNPASAEEALSLASFELLLRTLHVADCLNCRYIVLHPGEWREGLDDAPSTALQAEERVAAFLQEILKATEGSEVVIALENVPPYPNLLGTDAVFLERVLRRVGSARLGIVYDVGHAHMVGEGQCLWGLQRLLPNVIALHLSDNHGERDEHLALGAGSVPLEAAVALVCASGIAPGWVLEMRNIPDAQASADWLDRCLKGR